MSPIRTHFRRTALIVLLTLVVTPLLAQRGPQGFHGRFHGEGRPLGQMLDRLDLTDDQREQIEGLLAQRHESMRDKMESMRARRLALTAAIHAEEFDETAIRDAAAAVAELEADFAVERAAGLRDVLEVLTPEQRDEARQMMLRHREHMESGQRGFRGPQRFHGPGPAGEPRKELDN